MKTISVALIFAAAIACSKDKAKTKTVPPQPKAGATGGLEKPEQAVANNAPVSSSLAVSPELAAACGIKVPAAGASPKFAYDKDELADDDKAVLDQIAVCLTKGALKGKAISLIGRADPRGTEEYNLSLGSRRATSVGTYLQRLGVGQPQLAVTTRGALDATGTDETGWQQDRRVDLALKQ